MNCDAHIVELDVRPFLRKKIEPFKLIMDTVEKLGEEDTFILHATFNPRPLLGIMKRKGFVSNAEKLDKNHWKVTFVQTNKDGELKAPHDIQDSSSNKKRETNSDGPQVYELDNRGLEPPNPMIRTLSKLEACVPGDRVVIHNDRVPVFLIEELNALGYTYSIEEQSDGSARVTITKA